MIDSSTLQSQLIRAQSLQQAGRAGEAWALISPLRRAIDRHGQALRLFALIAQQAGEIDHAADALRRVMAIERDPPEIIGALADMLGSAGRHDQALTLWTRLAALQPGIADAHLNRAISASDAGKPDVAVQAADEGLKRFPGHPRLLATRAMALKNAGRTEESLAAFDQAVAADPNRGLTRHNQGVALRAACRFDEACEAFAASERLGMRGVRFHANWAAAALEAERIDEAIDQYRRALAEDPIDGEARTGLTRLLVEYRGGEEAFAHYEQAARSSGSEQAWVDYAKVLLSHGRYQEAREVARRASAHFPNDRMLATIEAYAEGVESPSPGAALERIERLYGKAHDAPLPWLALLALRDGQPKLAADYCDQLIARDQFDQGAWSVLSVAWRLLDDPREQWLCDYERLVMVTDVAPIDGAGSAADYAVEVADLLDPLHKTRTEPGDQSLRGGTQTSGALFNRPDPAIQRFRRSVIDAASKAVAALPDDPTHPFLARRSTSLTTVGSWSVRLQGGGHHVSHYHNEGWMSSAYYARLPLIAAEDWAAQQGWIQFGVPPALFNVDLPPRRIVEPAEGRLVLFPSYMLHGTLPFVSGDRLTAAFDFQPA
jgi:tetratricopeptide (TPR) repeat protein